MSWVVATLFDKLKPSEHIDPVRLESLLIPAPNGHRKINKSFTNPRKEIMIGFHKPSRLETGSDLIQASTDKLALSEYKQSSKLSGFGTKRTVLARFPGILIAKASCHWTRHASDS